MPSRIDVIFIVFYFIANGRAVQLNVELYRESTRAYRRLQCVVYVEQSPAREQKLYTSPQKCVINHPAS